MMRKILLLLMLVSVVAAAKEPTDSVTIYCQIMGENTNVFGLGTKCKVKVDFGQGEGLWSSDNNKLVDENGKDIKFESMIDALNYMSANGWEYVDNMFFSKGSGNVIHYLLKRTVAVSDLEEATPATKGVTKKDGNKSKSSGFSGDDIY